ncbi:unnamed protein product [Closterium sp. NIES-54]
MLEYRPAGAAASAAADQSAASAPRVAAGNGGYSLFARKDGFAPSAIMRLEIALPTAAAADSSDAPAAPAASATSGASGAAGVLIALADCVRLAALPSLEPLTCLPRTAGATSLAWDAEGGVLCVAIKRRVLVLRFDGRSTFKEEREFTCPDAPRLLALPSPTTLCAATPTKYLLHHIPPPGTAGSGGSWRDMLPCGQVAPPSVVKLPRGEMLVGKDSIGLFLDASGRPLRSHGINWSRPPSHVAVMPPYALAKLPNYIEVWSSCLCLPLTSLSTSSPPPLFSNLPLPSTPQDFRLPSLSSPSSARPPPCTSSSSPPSPSAPSTLSLFSLLKVLPSPSEPIDFTLPLLSKTSANAALHHHYEPQTIHEARTDLDAAEWIKAADAELTALHANDTYSVVPRPPTCKPIPCKWIFKVKEHADGSIERRKARLVVKGFKQRDGVDFHDTFAPTVRFATLRLFLTIAAAFDLEVNQLDISNAFLNGTLDEILYMMQPPGYELPAVHGVEQVCLLHKPLYGLKQAPRCWYRKLREELAAFRLFAARADPGLFIAPPQSPYRPTAASFFMLLVYVDDLIILSSSSSLLFSFKRALSSRFKLRDLGPLSYYLGFHITRDRTSRTLHLHQSKFITSILDTYSFTPLNPAATPMDTKFQLPVTSSPHSSFPYTSFVGSIMYAMVGSRPDLAYSTGVLARHIHDWSTPHVSVAKRVARYLKGTTSLGLLLGGIPNVLELHGWCDATWGPEGELRRSVTCYLFFLGPSLISWQSKHQAVVATSSCEAEYYSLGAAVHEALWLRSLLTALGLPPTGSTRISCDNSSAIILAKDDGVFHPKAKHIDIKHHFIRDHVADHSVTLLYVPTQDNLADIGTKPLPRAWTWFDFGELNAELCACVVHVDVYVPCLHVHELYAILLCIHASEVPQKEGSSQPRRRMANLPSAPRALLLAPLFPEHSIIMLFTPLPAPLSCPLPRLSLPPSLAHHLFSSGESDRAMQQLALCSSPPLLPALSLFPFLPSLPSSILSLATASSPYPPSFPSASPSSPSYPLSPSSTPSAAATPLGVQSQSDLTGRQRKLALLSLVVFLAEKRAAAVAAAAAATSSSAPAAAPASATAAADSLEKEGEENEGEEQQSMSAAEATAVVIDTYLSLALQTLTPLPPPLPPSSTLPAPAATADASAAAAATAAEAAAAAAEAEERAIPHSAPSAAAESPPDSPETAFDFNHSLFSSSGPLTFGQRPSPPPPAATSSSYNTHGSLGSNIKSGDATATVESSSSSNNLGASGGGGGGGVSFEGPLDAASVSRAAAAVTAAASAAAVTAAASAAAVTAAASAAAVTAAASAAAVRTGDGHGQALAIQAAPSEFSPAAVDRFIAALSVQTSLSQPHPPAASPSLVIPNQEGRGVGTDNGLFQMQSEGAGRGGGGASMSAAGVADSADPMHPLRSALHVLWAADNVCHVSTVEAALREEDRWRDVIRFLFFKGLHREGLVFLREMLKGGGVGMGWEGEEGTEPVGRRKGEGEGMEGEGEGGGSGDDDDGGGGDGTRGRRRDADVVENCFKEYVELLGQQPRQQPLVLEALTWRFQDDPTAALALLTSLRHPPPNGGPSSQCLLPRTYLGADRSASPCSQLIFLPQPPPLPTPPDLVLSLIRQVAPHLSASFLQHLLEQTAQAMGEAGGGSGLLSAFLLFLCCCPVVPSPLSLPTRPGALAYSPGGPSPQQHRPPASSSCSFPPSLSTFISPPDLVLSLIRQVAPHLSASFLEHLLEQTAQLPHCSLHVPPCSLPVSHHFPPHLTPPDLVLSLIRQVAPHLSASFLEHLLEQTAQAMGEGGGGEGVEEGEGEDVEEGSGDGWRGSRGSGGGGGESGREGGESGRRWSSSSGAGAPGGGAGGGGVGEVQDVGAAASQLQLDLQWCGCVWRWSRGGSGGAGRGGSGITATARPGELEPLELKFECTREFLRFRVEWILFFTAPVPLG